MAAFARHIHACLAVLGGEDFAPLFCDLVEAQGIGQIMVFSIAGDHARCLLSRNFSAAGLGGRLAATYLDGWFRQDPLLPDLCATAPGSVDLRRFEDIAPGMSAAYRQIFFDAPGLRAKTTLLAVGERLRLFVNLYRTGAEAEVDPDVARLIGRLALLHFERVEEGAWPAPLMVLSARERAVCLGILSGRTAEQIAGDLDLAPSTVVTYRKRAYDKLGVGSRAGLFAICRG
ncbi:MAG: helix-turn-helix transcriptional regulator [Paracoccaceae bacterium]